VGWSTLNRGQVHTCKYTLGTSRSEGWMRPPGPCGRLAEQMHVAQRAPRAPEEEAATWHASAQLARLAGPGEARAPRICRQHRIEPHQTAAASRTQNTRRSAKRGGRVRIRLRGKLGAALGARHVLKERAGTCREAGQAARHLSGAAGQNSPGVGRAPPAHFGQHTLSAAGARAKGAVGFMAVPRGHRKREPQ
jgi:hypothetical protein